MVSLKHIPDPNAQQKLEELHALLNSKQNEKALGLSQILIKEHSELSLPWLLQAQAAEKAGQTEIAEFYYSKVLTLEPDSLIARAGVALMTMHQLKLPEAIVHFRAAVGILLTETVQDAPPNSVANFNTRENASLLWHTLALLAKHNIHAVAHAGTLLGLIRQGSLLPGDKDLDIALPHHEMQGAVDCLLQNGWQINPLPMPLTNPISCRHAETGLVLDLCAVRVEASGKVVSGLWTKAPRDDWQRITVFSQAFSIQQVMRPEGAIWSLIEPESWLTDLYGDWKTPDPEFDTIIFAANMRGFSLLTQCYAYNRLLWNWKKGGLGKALRIARVINKHQPEDDLLAQCIRQLSQQIMPEESI